MAKIIVFKKQNYDGDALVITDSTNLKGTGFNDDISSVIVVEGSWVLYKDKDYSGNSFPVWDSSGPSDDGCYPSYSDWGQGNNNKISSIQLVS
tara:strand:+ start:197 stop:475 length:279 start_codon:yes stop_codon:yes gene_type:complete